MFNWIFNDILQCLEQFKFIDICKTELFERELFDHFINLFIYLFIYLFVKF